MSRQLLAYFLLLKLLHIFFNKISNDQILIEFLLKFYKYFQGLFRFEINQ